MSDLHNAPGVMFRGELGFLSNFHPCEITYKGRTYQNSEAAFQAQKCLILTDAQQREYETADPGLAKRLGRVYPLRPDWEVVKVQIMREILEAKFQDPELRAQLLVTGDLHLEETNVWGDKYWGTVDGVGKNQLGLLLMELRQKLCTN